MGGEVKAQLSRFNELKSTLCHIRQYRALSLFLAAYWLYIDRVNTVIKWRSTTG